MTDDEKQKALAERSAVKAYEFEKCIADAAKKLGMQIIVKHTAWEYRLIASLIPAPREVWCVAEDMFVRHPGNVDAMISMLQQILENLQLKLHDATRKKMDELDVCKRIVNLSREDRDTLHEMYNDASLQVLSKHQYGPPQNYTNGQPLLDKYSALLGKLLGR